MGKRIIIIDDAKVIRELVEAVLSSEGYEIFTASDGIDALQKLKNETEIDLIICDMNMPNMNGDKFLNSLKQDSAYIRYRYTPFIMLTTESGSYIREKGKENSVSAWLIKPFHPQALIDTVTKLIY